jgi:hypothetical protein
MDSKYKNFTDTLLLSNEAIETTIDVSRYITEVWSYDGNSFKKTTEDTSSRGSTVKIPPVNLTIEEFLLYTDMLARTRSFVFQEKPIPRVIA